MAHPLYNDDADGFTIPDRGEREGNILAYGNAVISKGLTFLQGQPAYADIAKGRSIVHSMETYALTLLVSARRGPLAHQ